MAQSGFLSFLLFLGLVVSNAYGDNDTILCEKILNATLNNAKLSDFNLTVSPAKLQGNTSYTVLLDGAGNFTVLLKAVSQMSSVGNWTEGNHSCNGSPLFIGYFISSKRIQTTWRSPENVTSVTIEAYIHNDTDTFLLHHPLSQEANSATNTTTAAPTTARSTESSKPSHTVTSPSHHTEQTTSAGCIEQSRLVPMALSVILGLLLIPNKYLSQWI